MATALEASRMLLWWAASALDSETADKVELCAMAKCYVTDARFDVADRALHPEFKRTAAGCAHDAGQKVLVKYSCRESNTLSNSPLPATEHW